MYAYGNVKKMKAESETRIERSKVGFFRYEISFLTSEDFLFLYYFALSELLHKM